MARALAGTGAKILIVERGDFIPQEDHNWNPDAVWKDLRYRTTETWLDEAGQAFRPYTHYCVGGNTKFWGTVMYRLRREDFRRRRARRRRLAGVADRLRHARAVLRSRRAALRTCTGSRASIRPRARAVRIRFRRCRTRAVVGDIVEQLQAQGLHPSPLPLGLRENCIFCNTCNSFPCKIHAKSDADVCAVRPAMQQPNVTLWTNAMARRLLTDASGKRVEAVEVERGGDDRAACRRRS